LRENTLGKILRTPPCLLVEGLEKGEKERTAAAAMGEEER
jgi:hypothetical protein